MRKIILSLLTGTALAAAMALPAAAASRAFDGPYVGVFAGYSFGDVTAGTGAAADDLSLNGFEGGAYVGVGQTFDIFYVGAEGEIGYTNLDADGVVGVTTYDFATDWTYGLSARAGVLATRDVLVYARVGYQWTGAEGFGRAGTTTARFDRTFKGWRFGGGAEYALNRNLLTRLDYTYTDYNRYSPVTIGGTLSGVEPSAHAIRLGLAYRF